MLGQLTPGEEAQLNQTIEMFEVITDSQPLDYQSLEILKEAYLKLNRQRDVIRTSKRIASAYVQLGQLSSALLEYETILQRYPDDPEVLAAMAEIQARAGSINPEGGQSAEDTAKPQAAGARDTSVTRRKTSAAATPAAVGDDGREIMQKLFVEGRIITAPEFNECWLAAEPPVSPETVVEPFIQLLADRNMTPIEKSIRVISDRTRTAFLSLEKYDVDAELARSFPKDLCRRWCVLPFDRMSKSVLIGTANPFNKRAEEELRQHTQHRILWYLAMPEELKKGIEKLLR